MRIYRLHIPSIRCQACISPIEKALKENNKYSILNVSVDPITKNASVKINVSDDVKDGEVFLHFKNAIEDIGHECENYVVQQALEKKNIYPFIIKGILGLLGGTAILVLSILGIHIPQIASYVIGGVSTLLTLYLGKETYYAAAKKLIKRQPLSMDSLFTVSTLIILGVSIAAFFIPWMHMMFDAALLLLGFKNIGSAIQQLAKNRLMQSTFQSSVPSKITCIKEDLLQQINVADIQVGQVIRIYAGQTIPLDGVCLTDKAMINKNIIIGSVIPQPIAKDDTILAGCIVPKDIEYIDIQVTATQENSLLARKDRRIENIEDEKTNFETITSRVLQYFIPSVLGIALTTGLIVGFLISVVSGIDCGIAILVAACPCTLGLITPLAVKTGFTKAEKHGISFKNGKEIEKAAEIDTVVFDLNGTLTTGVPRVVGCTVSQEMWGYLHWLESAANVDHPIAKAIVDFSKNQKTDNLVENGLITKDRCGVVGEVNGDTFIIGNQTMMKNHGINNIPELKNADHVVYLAKNGVFQGYLSIEDPLRDDAASIVKILQNQGKKIYICTGADENTALRYANQLGIKKKYVEANYSAIASDEQNKEKTKEYLIQTLQERGRKVCMVGDSGNDVEAVARSDFSIAICSQYGDKNTQAKAGAVINPNSLSAIPKAFLLAKQTVNNIKQNLAISMVYNFLALITFSGLLAYFGIYLNPAFAAAAMIVQTALILLNVERFRHQSVPSPRKIDVRRPPEDRSNSPFKPLLESARSQSPCRDISIKSHVPPFRAKPSSLRKPSRWDTVLSSVPFASHRPN